MGLFHHGRDPYRLARYVFLGPGAGDEPVKIGIFAALHGDEAGRERARLVEFLLCLHLDPERARGCQIFVYPICNPTGFEDGTRLTRRGHDLQRELWNGSRQPEAYYLERELGVLQFHGVVNLRSAENNGIHAHVASPTLNKALVQPALKAAGKFLPRDENRKGDQIIPATTVGRNRYEWGLGNPAELKPAPFEITLETPRKAPPELQAKATVAALNSIIEEYRPFLASQPNI